MTEEATSARVRTGGHRVEDNGLGRLLTLSDGVFAIAMTLLALDLKVPDLGSAPNEHALVHALVTNVASYWSYLLTFLVIARYWNRHRELMRSAVRLHPAVIRDTLLLLLLVAAMPFPASLLGRYTDDAVSLVLYGAINALATFSLMLLSWDMRRLRLADHAPSAGEDYSRSWQGWLGLVTFLLCIPAPLVLGNDGLFVLLLLAIPERLHSLRRLWRPAADAADGPAP